MVCDGQRLMRTKKPNKPDAPNPAIAPRFHLEHRLRRVGDPGRWVAMRHVKRLLMSSFLAALLGGCSKQNGLSLAGTEGSGDLVSLAMQCAASRGGHASTNTLPVVQANWTHQSREIQDVILVDGDHFAEIQKVLEQAFGAPDTKLGSSTVAPVGAGRSLTYSPQQIGVVLNLTADSRQTVVSVMGKKNP